MEPEVESFKVWAADHAIDIDCSDSRFEQDLFVGDWMTWPTYDMFVQPLKVNPWPYIWKDPK